MYYTTKTLQLNQQEAYMTLVENHKSSKLYNV
jgi:hypothetical protein